MYYENNSDPLKYNMELVQSAFEADSYASIIPVGQLYSQTAIALNHLSNLHVALDLPVKIIA